MLDGVGGAYCVGPLENVLAVVPNISSPGVIGGVYKPCWTSEGN